jgi:hypothetical protein
MGDLSYTTYEYNYYVLSQEEFDALKPFVITDREYLRRTYSVDLPRELLRKFAVQIVLVAICVLFAISSMIFFPNPESGIIQGLLYGAFLGAIVGGISLAVSLVSFTGAIKQKRYHSQLLLYLLESCPDHKTYVDEFYKHVNGYYRQNTK